MTEILVIDIGGTKTTVSIVDRVQDEIKLISLETFQTLSLPNLEINRIEDFLGLSKYKIDSMSLSLPGVWDKHGILQESTFLSKWIGFPFIRNLSSQLNIKNYIFETDVICGALGEYNALVETLRATSLLYINLGTGIGAALIKDGKPYKANSKLTLRMQNLLFPNENILYKASDLISGGELIKHTNYKSIEELYSAYKKANVEAVDLISRAQLQLATWLINLFYLFAPDLIVLNGGLTYDWEVLAEEAIEIAKEELENKVQILPSKLKELAPVYGAYSNYVAKSKNSLKLK